MDINKGKFFSKELSKEIRERFCYVDEDPIRGKRLFFENSGGSFRLKSVIEANSEIEAFPDCPERVHDRSLLLKQIQLNGLSDLRIVFNAKDGAILQELTASQAMFNMVGAIMLNTSGTNVITTELEHPSAFDAVEYYAKRTGREVRVAKANKATGGIDTESVINLIDKDTCLVSVMYASNLSGAIQDLEAIVSEARKIKPDIYIITDAVQHAPHGILDVEKVPVDGINFAPYKFFGNRGMGFAYVSDRVARLPHHKLLKRPEKEWELGSPCPSNFKAITAVVDYVCWIGSNFTESIDRRTLYIEGMNRIKLHERALMDRMLNGSEKISGLRNIKGISVYLDTESLLERDLIVAAGIDSLDFTKAVAEYAKRGVIVFERISSSPYSQRGLAAFGLDGLIRISPLHCHNAQDIDEFLRITTDIARDFAEKA
jgi:selenocysteine lyase/cysteine desulfurase